MHPSREPIDAVITWVDGSDKNHAVKLQSYLNSQGMARPSSVSDTRLDDAGELELCVLSIFRFAPWIRRIHIVSDAQTPAFLTKLSGTRYESRVRVVDHREIFAGHESALPTFNVRSIALMLTRIDGLADKFLFFNDDFFLLREVSASDFYRNGKTVLLGPWMRSNSMRRRFRRIFERNHVSAAKKRPSHLEALRVGAAMAGEHRQFLSLDHKPHPIIASSLTDFFSDKDALLRELISHRFRSADQCAMEGLSAHLELARGNAVIDHRLKTIQLKPADRSLARLARKIATARRNPAYRFACVQGLGHSPSDARQMILTWTQEMVGSLEAFLSQQREPSQAA